MNSEGKTVLLIIALVIAGIVSIVAIYCYSSYLDTKMHIDAGHQKRMMPATYHEVWVDPKTQAEITP